MTFKSHKQRRKVMAKLTSGEKAFLIDVMNIVEKNGATLGSRIMAKRLKPKLRKLK